MNVSSYQFSLNREGFRLWIMHLQSPVVIVATTEEAQRDLEWASGRTDAYAPCPLSFADLLSSFGSFSPAPASAGAAGVTQHEPQCPKNVTVRLTDRKRKSLDIFPVRFISLQTVVERLTTNVHEKLLRAVAEHPPPIEALQLRHQLHSFSVRNQPVFSNAGAESEHTEQPNEDLARPIVCDAVALNHSSACVHYPHSILRHTDTYKHSDLYTPLPFVPSQNEFLAYDTWLLQVLADSFLTTSAADTKCNWWEAWIKEFCTSLDFLDPDTLCTPIAFVYVVSSRQTDAVGAIQQLSSTLASISCGFPEVNAGCCYVLLDCCVPNSSDANSAQNGFKALQEAYPPSSCHLIRLTPPVAAGGFLEQNAAEIQTLATTVIVHTVIPTLERLLKRLADQTSHQRRGLRNQLRSLWTRRPRSVAAGLSTAVGEAPFEHTADIFWGTLSGEPGASRSTVDKHSGSKNVVLLSPTASAKTSEAQTPTSDLAGRLLGDAHFYLGDYPQAAAAYRTAAADFRHSKVLKQQGSALEMLGVCLMLSGEARSEIESAFNQAVSCYFESLSPYLALRAQIKSARALLCLDSALHACDAAEKLDRLSCDIALYESSPNCENSSLTVEANGNEQACKIMSKANSVRSALLLEQVGVCYSLAGKRFFRKMQFYFVLAGHTYSRTGLKAHALRCYSIALNNLGGYRWCYVSDHLLFSLARQAFTLRFLADSLVFFFHLLNNLVIQSVPSHLGYSLPLYSRLTAFSGPDTNAYLLPMDSQTLQKTMGFTSPSASNVNREATYVKEALYVCKAWSSQIEAALATADPTSNPYLQAFQMIRFELSLPCIHSTYAVCFDSDPEVCENSIDIAFTKTELQSKFKIPITQEDIDELLFLCQKIKQPKNAQPATSVIPATSRRTVSLGEAIFLNVMLFNPLQIPLECHDMKPYCTLNSVIVPAEEVVSDSAPVLIDANCSGVSYTPQHIRLEPHQTLTLSFSIVPTKPGLLKIRGLCWDLYNVIKVFAPLETYMVRRPTKDIMNLVTHLRVTDLPLFSGDLASSDPAQPLLRGTMLEMPLSLEQNASLLPVTLRKAVLVAQSISNGPNRMQSALRCLPRLDTQLVVSSSHPRVTFCWNNWPQQLIHGERRKAALSIKNVGCHEVSALRILVTPNGSCFFSSVDAPQDPAHLFQTTTTTMSSMFCLLDPLKPSEQKTIFVTLRGSFSGAHHLVFCAAVDTGSPKKNDAQLTCCLRVNTFLNTVDLIKPTRKWYIQTKSLFVLPSLQASVVLHPSSCKWNGLTVVFSFQNMLPSTPLDTSDVKNAEKSVLMIEAVECFFSGTTVQIPLTPYWGQVSQDGFDLSFQLPYRKPSQLAFSATLPTDRISALYHRASLSKADLACETLERSRLSKEPDLLSIFESLRCYAADHAAPSGQNGCPATATCQLPGKKLAADFIIYWKLLGVSSDDKIIRGETFLQQIPLAAPTSSCPIRCTVDIPSQPPCAGNGVFSSHNATSLSKRIDAQHSSQRVCFTLHNTSLDKLFTVAAHLNHNTLSLHEAVEIEQNGFASDHETQKDVNLHPALRGNQLVSQEHAAPLLPATKSQLLESQPLYVGSTQFTTHALKPGEKVTKTMAVVLPKPGLYNLSRQCQFRVQTFTKSYLPNVSEPPPCYVSPDNVDVSVPCNSFIFYNG